jgi:hypothetical protein
LDTHGQLLPWGSGLGQNFPKKTTVTDFFGHMPGALNINKIIKLIIQFSCKSRDESFKPS